MIFDLSLAIKDSMALGVIAITASLQYWRFRRRGWL
jgi:hypothetical protein